MNRRLILAVAVMLVAAASLFAFVNDIAFSHQIEQTLGRGRTTLRLAVSALDGRLGRYRGLPALVADEAVVRDLLQKPDDPALRRRVDFYLKKINGLLGSTDIYLMVPTGDTIAASNFDQALSFVGQNFSYRPYFKEALAGRDGQFFALGTTSGKRGYYFSAPVTVAGKVAGVVVFKIDFDQIEASWRGNSEYEIVVLDPEGIIFLTSRKEWLYGTFKPVDETMLAHTRGSRRYAGTPLSRLPVGSFEHDDGYDVIGLRVNGEDRQYAALTRPMQSAGWAVRVLVDTRPAHIQALTAALAAVLVLGLIVVVVALVLRERSRLGERIRLHRRAQEDLEERVLLRTNDLALANRRLEEEVRERRATENQLRQTQSDLVQAGKLAALGQMSAALSHEFNQPLAALAVYADNAAAYLDRRRTGEARANIGRMAKLIERLSTMSRHLRSFARKPDEQMRPVAIREIAEEVVDIMARRLEAADASVELDLDPQAATVMAGTVRLQQVLLNLIANAADAVEGLPDRTITLASRPLGRDRVVVSVRDRGPGVPAGIVERIFDPFFTTKGPGKGLGLGLSISYNIVKDFGGVLAVGQDEGGGAVFTIELERALIGETAEIE